MRLITTALILLSVSHIAFAQNPVIQTNYTADPAPMVYDGRVFLYTTHDEENSTWSTMNDWRLYTTGDMVNWTDHGTILSYTDFVWAKGDAWSGLSYVQRKEQHGCDVF
jgi:sucrose-6-phosphate hydrolase SacC (GH32 family)